MTPTVRIIHDLIDHFAPFASAMEKDNVGLLVGDMEKPVRRIVMALDATPGVVAEAASLDADLIITHHPLMFAPIRRIREDDPEGRVLRGLIRADLSLIAAHTNLDIAKGGVNDSLANRMGLSVSRVEAEGYLRVGSLPSPMPLHALADQIASKLSAHVMCYGAKNRSVSTYAICSGRGGSMALHAANLPVDVFITGEINHEHILSTLAMGTCVLAAGHRQTEICFADTLASHLQSALNALQFRVEIITSNIDPFA